MTSCKIRIVCISDTHNHRPGEGFTLPKGDVLIHAGDFTNQGTVDEVKKAIEWISAADFDVKIVVAGNHDTCLDPAFSQDVVERVAAGVEECRKLFQADSRLHYLQHSSEVIQVPGKGVSLRVFGSPYSPSRDAQPAWGFQYDEEVSKTIWDTIPQAPDILVTHTPSAGLCDTSQHWQQGGCEALRTSMSKIRPLLHVCGHCHEGRGAVVIDWNNGVVSRTWQDPGTGKKQSLLDLTGVGRSATHQELRAGTETAIVNASIIMRSHSQGQRKGFHKPVVVDLLVNQNSESEEG